MRTRVGSNPNAKNKVFSISVKVKGGSGGTTPRPPSLPHPRPLVPQHPQVAISRNLPPASSSRHERGYALLSPTLRSNPPPPPLPPLAPSNWASGNYGFFGTLPASGLSVGL